MSFEGGTEVARKQARNVTAVLFMDLLPVMIDTVSI